MSKERIFRQNTVPKYPKGNLSSRKAAFEWKSLLITSAAVCSVPSAHIRICPILLILPAHVQNLIFRTLCFLFVFVDVSLFVGSDPPLLSALFLGLLSFASLLGGFLRRTLLTGARFFPRTVFVVFGILVFVVGSCLSITAFAFLFLLLLVFVFFAVFIFIFILILIFIFSFSSFSAFLSSLDERGASFNGLDLFFQRHFGGTGGAGLPFPPAFSPAKVCLPRRLLCPRV